MSTATPRVTPRSIADFETITLLGTGSLAKVFRVREISTGLLYAMKIISKNKAVTEGKTNGIMMEKHILTKLSHPNIIKIFSAFQDQHQLYFQLELGKYDLRDAIRKFHILPMECIQFYIAEVIQALLFLHKNNFIHGDIKPENILLIETGHVTLIDFESADKINPNQQEKKKYTGTLPYLPPEFFIEPELMPTPCRSRDFWSLGCTLYALIVGYSPFNMDEHLMYIEYDAETTISNILHQRIHYPLKIDPDVHDLISKLLNYNKDERIGMKNSNELLHHPFFKNINWDNLSQQTPPNLMELVKKNLIQINENDSTKTHGEFEEDFLELTPSIGNTFLKKRGEKNLV